MTTPASASQVFPRMVIAGVHMIDFCSRTNAPTLKLDLTDPVVVPQYLVA